MEQRLKEAKTNKLSSNASIQDIITNSVEEYRKQEQTAEAEAEEDESFRSSFVSSDEESLSQEMMSLDVGGIAEIAKIMTDGVTYRTDEGMKQLNGDKIRKLFVKQLRKLLRDNGDFEEKFIKKFRNISQKSKINYFICWKRTTYANRNRSVGKICSSKTRK